ncbi:MAG: energy-coupling factor transporter transmembrane protein EcfT [Acholeplasmataceae bacterium]
MNNIVIGQYIPGDSWIYKLDPRIKMALLIIIMVATFLVKNPFLMMGLFLIMISVFLSSKVPFLKMIRGLKPLLFLLTFTFFIQIFSLKTGNLLFETTMYLGPLSIFSIVVVTVLYFLFKKQFKLKLVLFFLWVFLIFFLQAILPSSLIKLKDFSYQFQIYDSGLYQTSFLILRILIIIILSSLLTFTTMPTDITNGLESLLKPLKIIKFPVGELATMLSLTLRFIPSLLEETNKIIKAQASRGAEFSEASFKKKLVQIISLLIPIFVISFKRAEDLANAMEVRGYIVGGERTKIDVMKIHYYDYLALSFGIVLLATSILFRVGVFNVPL